MVDSNPNRVSQLSIKQVKPNANDDEKRADVGLSTIHG